MGCVCSDTNSEHFMESPLVPMPSPQDSEVVTAKSKSEGEKSQIPDDDPKFDPAQIFGKYESWARLSFGLFLCYFGGQFPTLILVAEAFFLTGYASTIKSMKALWFDLVIIFTNLKSVASEIGALESAKMKSMNFDVNDAKLIVTSLCKIKIQPFVDAFWAWQTAVLTSFACLRVGFAKSITLGNSLGTSINPSLQHYAEIVLKSILPPDYWEMFSPLLSFSVNAASITIAYYHVKVIAGYQAAICGSAYVSRAFNDHFLSSLKLEKSVAKIVCDSLTILLVIYAMEFQISTLAGFHPFVQYFLFPFTIVENELAGFSKTGHFSFISSPQK